MKHVIFAINPCCSEKKALEELTSHGLQHPYVIEELEGFKIGGFLDIVPPSLSHMTLVEHSAGVDWDQEWKMHSPYYKNGLLEIDLNQFGAQLSDSTIYLRPGPGFGDVSHATTQQMLAWMVEHVPGKHVLDIGCGSGVLSLAAHKMGATSVTGLDIDPAAIDHAKTNALLNDMKDIVFAEKTTKPLENNDLVILINMTFHEQKEVFHQYPLLEGTFIVSGILESQIASYIESFPYPYHQIHLSQQDGWLILYISNQH